jgi:lipopolysaccharide export system protein LptA
MKIGRIVTPSRLRTWILALTGTLVAVIAIFFFYGRWQGRRFGHDLPDGLSSGIQQSTQGFTYSESRGPHTIYTLHASKAVQFKSDGHAELHDVSITLYNAQGAPANRIYGRAFDWDPAHGIARALGEVQIDFQDVAAASPPATKAPEDEGESKNTVHIKTSGLVFNKQTGLASTTERLEFRTPQAAGSATGASFDSQNGVMILTADVAFNSSVGGNPLAVRAHHAQFDRSNRLLYLLQDVTDYADNHASSDQATVSFRADGSAYQVLAQGNVIVTGDDGQKVNARIAHIDLGPKSEPRQAILQGGVLYVADTPARLIHGSAAAATLLFDPQPTIRHAQLRTAVSVVEEEKAPEINAAKAKQNFPQSSTRQVQASQVDIDFASGPDRSPQARQILAVGGARLNVHTIYTKTQPEDTTVQGDQLLATLVDGEVLSSLKGDGHTSLVSVSPAGVTQSSKGDNLLLTFAPPDAAQKAGQTPKSKAGDSPSQLPAQLQSAIQWGNVTLVQQDAAPSGGPAPPPTTATAQRVTYEASSQQMQLSGNPRIQDPSGELAAALIEMERTTGNANATGGVKATYRQTNGQKDVQLGGAGPVHVVADHAFLNKPAGLTTFFGKQGEPARMWQESDSISAPVLEISRPNGTLSAHGGPGAPAAVNAVFAGSATQSTPNAKQKPTAPPSVVRVQSRTLFYSDNDHKAVFSGGVVAQTASGLLHSNFMDVYFAPAGGAKPPGKATQSSQVSKIVARGSVDLRQPDRKGTGEELTYTAEDGKFVLTGTTSAPPRLTDQVRGTVTGNALLFNDRDDSVVVSGGTGKAVTQTRVAK